MQDTSTTSTEQDERAAYTAGLRQLADWLDAHPDIELPWAGGEYSHFELAVWTTREHLAAIAKALPGRVEKTFHSTTMDITARFQGLHVRAYAGRAEVCERIVVGTEKVTVPAVEAKPETVEEREVVEWRCHPLLADEPAGEQVSA